jgi:NADH:ubiquinone oxidoreductase subunit 2 (subunit N)
VFKLAIEQAQWFLLVVAIVGAAAGFYYYLKIAASMYLSEPNVKRGEEPDNSTIPIGKIARVAMILLIAAIFLVGVNPNLILGLLS